MDQPVLPRNYVSCPQHITTRNRIAMRLSHNGHAHPTFLGYSHSSRVQCLQGERLPVGNSHISTFCTITRMASKATHLLKLRVSFPLLFTAWIIRAFQKHTLSRKASPSLLTTCEGVSRNKTQRTSLGRVLGFPKGSDDFGCTDRPIPHYGSNRRIF